MRNKLFVGEYYNSQRFKSIATFFAIFICFVFVSLLFSNFLINLVENNSTISAIYNGLKEDIMKHTLRGLFLAHLIGGLFFVPSPDELLYYYALSKGNTLIYAFLLSLLGYICAQAINYVIGLKLSNMVLGLVSKKKVYQTRRFTNKYGGIGLFLSNLIFIIPAPLLSLGLGLTKYNFKRLILMIALGKGIVYGSITLIYVLTH